MESRYLDAVTVRFADERRAFVSLLQGLYRPPLPDPCHSHGVLARGRLNATEAIYGALRARGLEPYPISASQREEGGQRLYYTQKDLREPFRNSVVNGSNALVMIDVDYYVDINWYLSFGLPVVLYTMLPCRAAGRFNECTYTFSSDQCLDVRVDGGAHYHHMLWDYTVDFVSVPSVVGGQIAYDVQVLRLDELHAVVMLLPRTSCAVVAFPYQPVKRLAPVSASVTVIRIGNDVSLAHAGAGHAVTVPHKLFQACKIRLQETKTPNIAVIERILRNEDVDSPAIAAPMLFRLLGCHTSSDEVHYQAINGLVHEDGRNTVVSCTPLIVPSAVAPVRSCNNDQECLRGRVESVRNTAVPSYRYARYAQEFSSLVVPRQGCGVPISFDEVAELQGRPEQVARREQGKTTVFLEGFLVRAFQKRETYGKITSPRNISTVPPSHQLLLSSYAYSFKRDCLKDLEWYHPGLHPREVSSRIHDLAQRGPLFTKDFSRFDGTISAWLRLHVEQSCYLRWVNPEDRAMLMALLKQEVNARGITSHGLPYSTGASRLSGSPVTTDANTLINAFSSYAVFRELGLGKNEAWESLGLYCGDDGVDMARTEHFVQVSEAVANDLGLKLTGNLVNAGPVLYCGRVFCNPWVSLDSMQDPIRTLGKLHVSSAAMDVPLETALANKAFGYGVTDPRTPWLSEWCQAVLRRYEPDFSKATKSDIWRSHNPWVQDDPELINATFYQLLGLDPFQAEGIRMSILESDYDPYLPILDHFQVGEVSLPAFPVVIGGQLLETPPGRTDNEVQPVPAPVPDTSSLDSTSQGQAPSDSPRTRASLRRQRRRAARMRTVQRDRPDEPRRGGPRASARGPPREAPH